MAKLADALALGASTERYVGSSPTLPTTKSERRSIPSRGHKRFRESGEWPKKCALRAARPSLTHFCRHTPDSLKNIGQLFSAPSVEGSVDLLKLLIGQVGIDLGC